MTADSGTGNDGEKYRPGRATLGVCGQVEGKFRMFEARNGNVPFRNGAVLALPGVDLSISER